MTYYSTLWTSEVPGFGGDVIQLPRNSFSRLYIIRRLLSMKEGDALLLNGAMGLSEFWIDLLFGLAIRLAKKRVVILISDATWHSRSIRSDSRIPLLHQFAERFGKYLLLSLESKYTNYCFLSRSEVKDFVREAGVDEKRVHFTPFFASISSEELARLRLNLKDPEVSEPFIFSGGNSCRDWDLLATAVEGTGLKVRAATSKKMNWPEEIDAGPVSHNEFLDLMARCRATAIILDSKTRRSVGQQTYLNAMLMGRPVIINDVTGVRDYVDPGETAIVVPPNDTRALREALLWVMDKSNAKEVRLMTEKAAAAVRTRRPGFYIAELDDLLRKVTAASFVR